MLCSSDRRDLRLLRNLMKFLKPLARELGMDLASSDQTLAGSDFRETRTRHLNSALAVLLLISQDLVDEPDHEELVRDLLARQERGEFVLIPVRLRHTWLGSSPLADLQLVPSVPLDRSHDRDQSMAELVQAVGQSIRRNRQQSGFFLRILDLHPESEMRLHQMIYLPRGASKAGSAVLLHTTGTLLKDPSVASLHASFSASPHQLTLTCLTSEHSTRVAGKTLRLHEEVALRPSQEIWLGQLRLLVDRVRPTGGDPPGEGPREPASTRKARRYAWAVALEQALQGWKPENEPSSLRLVKVMGEGANGTVASAHMYLPRKSEEMEFIRVRWLIVKVPAPGQGGVVDNTRIVLEVRNRHEIGPMPGIGPLPYNDRIPVGRFRPFLKDSSIVLPESECVEVLIFRHPDDRLMHLPASHLGATDVARRGVQVWRDLLNWCMVARTLGSAIFELHRRGWAHCDLSLGNVLVRETQRYFQTVELIDFEHASRLEHPEASHKGTPLFRGRRRLREALKLDEPDPGAGPKRLANRRRVQDQVALGTVLGLLLVGGEVISHGNDPLIAPQSYLRRNPDRFGATKADEYETRSSSRRVLSSILRRVEALYTQIGRMILGGCGPDRMRESLSQAALLVNHLMVEEEPVSVEWQHQFLSVVDTLRVEVLQSMIDWSAWRQPLPRALNKSCGSRSYPACRLHSTSPGMKDHLQLLKVDALADVLRSFEVYAVWEDELDWCGRFMTTDEECLNSEEVNRQFYGGNEVPADENSRRLAFAIALLKSGYVRLAERALRECLASTPAEASKFYDRVLRLLVGILFFRAEALDQAREVLEALRRMERGGGWWHALLSAHLRHREGAPLEEIAEALERLDHPDLERREKAWLASLRVVHDLRRYEKLGTEIPDGAIREIRQALRESHSGSEAVFAAIQTARCYAHNNELETALRYLHMGLAEAGGSKLPVEYALLLLWAARLVRNAFHRSDRVELRRQGLNDEAVLRAAEHLARHAAQLFAQLEMFDNLYRALGVAADCACLHPGQDALSRAFTLAELAYSNARLAGVPGQRVRRQLEEIEKRWEASRNRSGVREAAAESEYDALSPQATLASADPGEAKAELFYIRYQRAVSLLCGTGGLALTRLNEMGEPDEHGILADLLDKGQVVSPRFVLDFGCGNGHGVFFLAERYPQASIVGTDLVASLIEDALERRHRDGIPESRCALYARGEGGFDALRSQRWDLVVLRDVLCHIAFKRRFLKTLWQQLDDGALLLFTDWVQVRPSGPDHWQEILDTVWFNSLLTVGALVEALHEAGGEEGGFELVGEAADDFSGSTLEHRALEGQKQMHCFLKVRGKYLADSTDTEVARLRKDDRYGRVRARSEQMLTCLIAATDLESGPLGWISLVARKVRRKAGSAT